MRINPDSFLIPLQNLYHLIAINEEIVENAETIPMPLHNPNGAEADESDVDSERGDFNFESDLEDSFDSENEQELSTFNTDHLFGPEGENLENYPQDFSEGL